MIIVTGGCGFIGSAFILDWLAQGREPVLNLLFHSSEAIVGGSPYNRTQAELDAFLDRLERFLTYAVRELGAVPRTCGEFRARYCAAAAASGAGH